jgi:uncharacterized protein YbjT (DUF2867 family)
MKILLTGGTGGLGRGAPADAPETFTEVYRSER